MSGFSYKRVLVIGSSGGIGQEVVRQVLAQNSLERLACVSRSPQAISDPRCIAITADSTDEAQVEHAFSVLKQEAPFDLVILCIGLLHEAWEHTSVFPEKRLEEIGKAQMMRYFEVNTIAPALWLRVLPKLLIKREMAHVVFFSARVGSIEDNHLGGWYGYRASKAALNMLLKTAQIEIARRNPLATLVSYHPGTTDTSLSKPFQQNVPDGKLFTAAFTVTQLFSLLPRLEPKGAPHYLDWQGKSIPW